ncbi:hypothetical protein D5275_03155 [Adlercreutzia muris]|jgi:hypothetical protein|nr:hypothetical protein [Adlercreutzia muris]
MALAAAIVLALVGVCLTAPPAFAETIKKQWTVEFTGDKMEGNGSASLLQAVNGMQPGDSAEFTIDLYESSDKAADWYMRNEVLKSMEESFDDANSNSGGSYSYRLVYISPQNEEKVILTNEVVSGDKGAGDTQGLFDATESTGEWFYLDTLAPEALAKVILTVGIDGETHGNSYFDTSARVQSSFAAEPTDEPGTPGQATPPDPSTPKKDTPTSDQPKNPADQTEKAKGKLSQTGDMIPLTVIAVVAITAGILVVVVTMRNRRESREDEEGDVR